MSEPANIKKYVVAVMIRITTDGKHWFSEDITHNGMSMYSIHAESKEMAEELGQAKALKFRREKNPDGRCSILDSFARPYDELGKASCE